MALEDFYYGIPAQDTPDEGYLAKLAHVIMTPLGFLASTLDKPGRAVRSLLDGQGISSLLNLVPLSDTIGLTNPDDAPSGRDLLRKWGAADQEDTWGNWGAGLALDIATDPVNLFSFSTKSSLTALGRDALKADTLAKTAAGRIAAGQSGLMGLRVPWFIPGMSEARLPFLTGSTGENIAAGLSRAGDYLMHEAPVISGPLSKLQSMFKYASGWTGDRRYVQGTEGAVDAERGAIQAGFPHMTGLIGTSKQAIENLTSQGVPLESAAQYYGRAVTGARELGFPEMPTLLEIADPVARDQARSTLMQLVGQASGQTGDVYDAVREYARGLGIKGLGDDASLWGTRYSHRQSLEGGIKKGSQQTSRTIPESVTPGGTNQINDYVANPTYSGFANKPVPAGVSPAQWKESIEQQVMSNKESIAANAKAHRDYLAAQIDPLGMSMLAPHQAAGLTNEIIEKDAESFARLLSEVSPDVQKAGQYYRNDPVAATYEYINNLSKQSGTAQSVLSTIAKQAKPADATLRAATNPNDYVNLRSVLGEVGQDAIEKIGSEIEYGGKKSLLMELAKEGKTNAITPGWQGPIHGGLTDKILEGQVVPRDLVDVIKKEIAGPGYESKFGLGELIDKFTSGVRTGSTVLFPAYHSRNLGEGLLQQALGGGFSPTAINDVRQYLAGTLKDPAKVSELDRLAAIAFSNNTAFRNQGAHYLGESAVNNPGKMLTPWVTQDPNKSFLQGVTDAISSRFSPKQAAERGESYFAWNPKENTLVQAGVQTHNDIENLNRFSQFVALSRKGYSPEAAHNIVTSSQLDYSRLTPTERKLRQLIPFYSFSKQNLVRMAEQAQDPGALASLLRVGTAAGQDGYVPGYVSQGASVALPGVTDEGKTRYMSGFSLPFEDEAFGALAALASGDPIDAARRGLTTANPLLKLAATLATGRQIYSGRSLDEVTPSPITSLGGLINPLAANIASETLSATPAGRLFTTVNSSVAAKDQNLLLKLLTGIKTTDVDQQLATQMAARDAVSKALLRSGMVQTSQNYYPKQEYRDVEAQPEGLQYLLQMMKLMEQQSKDAAQARMANQQLP